MLTKAERRKIAMKNLAKAHKAQRANARRSNPRKRRSRGMREESAAIVKYDEKLAKEQKRKAAAKKAAATRKANAEKREAERKAASEKAAATRKAKSSTRRTAVAKKGKKGRKGHKLTEAQKKKMAAGRRRAAKARAEGKQVHGGKSKKARKSGTRKAHRTAAQKRATKKMIAANRRSKSHGGRKSTRRTTKARRGVRVVRMSAPRKKKSKKLEIVVSRPRRRSAKRKQNPLTGGREWGAGIAGFILGGAAVSFFDRLAATHPLSSGATGATGSTWYDTPTTGQIYNAEAVQAPLYTSGYRILIAALGIITPFGIAAAVKGPAAKSFFQLMGFGALGYTGVKLTNDILGAILIQSPYGARLYAPEIMAQTDMTAVGATGATQLPSISAPVHTVMPPANPPTLAGYPRQAPRLAAPAYRPQAIPQQTGVARAPVITPAHASTSPTQAPLPVPAPLAGLPNNAERLATVSAYFRDS